MRGCREQWMASLPIWARGIDIAMFRVRPESDSFASGIVDLLVNPHLNLLTDESVPRPGEGFPSDSARVESL